MLLSCFEESLLGQASFASPAQLLSTSVTNCAVACHSCWLCLHLFTCDRSSSGVGAPIIAATPMHHPHPRASASVAAAATASRLGDLKDAFVRKMSAVFTADTPPLPEARAGDLDRSASTGGSDVNDFGLGSQFAEQLRATPSSDVASSVDPRRPVSSLPTEGAVTAVGVQNV